MVRIDDALASPAPKALPAGRRCVLKRRVCVDVPLAEHLVRAVRPLSLLEHPNVVTYYGVLLGSGGTDVLLVCEFCSRGSVLDLIHHQRRQSENAAAPQRGALFGAELVLEILLQICTGLAYLHDEVDLAHGNISPTNILLDREGAVKITDVGLEDVLDSPDFDAARDVRDSASTRIARGGKAYWAPERSLANASNGGFLACGPSSAADCWAVGCIATELVCGVFVHERLAASAQAIAQGAFSLGQDASSLARTLDQTSSAASCGKCDQVCERETCSCLSC